MWNILMWRGSGLMDDFRWVDHIWQYPNRYRLQQNADGSITIIPEKGDILQQGTPVNAENLNKIIDALKTHEADNAAHDKIMVTGEYVGDGTSSRKIVLGFKPNIVILYQLNSNGYPISVHYRHGGYGYRLERGTSSRYTGASPAGYKYITPLIADDGFEVEYRDDLSDTNSANYNYVYMAIK